MTDSIKYSCLVDGYTARELLSGSTLHSIKDDLLATVHITASTFKAKPILTIESSAKIISLLDNIFYFYTAFLAQFASFTEQDRIKHDFRDKNIQDKISTLKEVLNEE